MDLLFIARDASGSSFVSVGLAAQAAKKNGKDVAIFVTAEALAAFSSGALSWPRELQGQDRRRTIADNGKGMGVELKSKGEGRQVDPFACIAKAHEAGIRVIACPFWTQLLDISGKLPEGTELIGTSEFVELLDQTTTVVGTL